MKKIKRMLALLVAMVMVMGMTVTAWAGKSATITVKNAGAEATFNYVQIIRANPETVTGWEIINEYEAAFTQAFQGLEEQAIIAGMIYEQDPNAGKGKEIQGFDTKYIAALRALFNQIPVGSDGPSREVSEAGVYFVKGNETNFVYSPMVAYVAFGQYVDGVPTDLEDTELNAKRTPEITDKSAEDENKVVEINSIQTYNVDGFVPFFAADKERTYTLTDTITGGKYVVNSENKVELTIKIGDSSKPIHETTVLSNEVTAPEDGKQTFTADLSSLVEDDRYASLPIRISYQAVVTDVQVGNDVIVGDADNDSSFGQDSENLYTAQITFTKYGENQATLAGAEFIVYKIVDEEKQYAKFDTKAGYKFKEWVTDEKAATRVITGEDGTAVVEGLDVGTYYFKEVKAPDGYSINEKDTEVTIEKADAANEIIKATGNMTDTKLSSLPETGGIGTTIFTIGGCVIMIAAAGLFFASRRKSAK